MGDKNDAQNESLSNKNSEQSKNKEGYLDSDFIPLDDLVYAPLHSLAKANHQLRTYVVDAIKSLGLVRQNGQEEVIHLDNINIAYEQVRSETEEGYSVDNMKLQVPLLSVVPITNLNVDKAEIDFLAEVRVEKEKDGQCQVNARISSPEQRESDFLPRVSYKLFVNSISATEGMMRLTDILSSNHVVKQMDTTPLAMDGNLGTEGQKDFIQKVKDLKNKIKKLKLLYQKISEMLAEQEKIYQISKDAYKDLAYDFDKEKYQMAQANIANRIMKYQEYIMNTEIEYGLDKDYE